MPADCPVLAALAPTLIEWAGGKPGAHIQGRSLAPLFGGRRKGWRKSILIEYWAEQAMPWLVGMSYKAVRTATHKYIHWVNRGRAGELNELYDLERDPFELRNLNASRTHDKVRASLQRELGRLLVDAHGLYPFCTGAFGLVCKRHGRPNMQVKEILRVKGNRLLSIEPGGRAVDAVQTMAQQNLGSLVVVDQGRMVGMLTFHEVMQTLAKRSGALGDTKVSEIMVRNPVTASPDMEVNDLRRTMLDTGARYLPVMQDAKLIGVISFRDVAKAVLEEQDFENKMLKGYIKNWPA